MGDWRCSYTVRGEEYKGEGRGEGKENNTKKGTKRGRIRRRRRNRKMWKDDRNKRKFKRG
jgi:hypothetical protein